MRKIFILAGAVMILATGAIADPNVVVGASPLTPAQEKAKQKVFEASMKQARAMAEKALVSRKAAEAAAKAAAEARLYRP